MFYSNMQLISHYLQFCIKLNISNTDEQKPISQMSVISVYVYVKLLQLKKFIDTIGKYPIRVSVSWLVFR